MFKKTIDSKIVSIILLIFLATALFLIYKKYSLTDKEIKDSIEERSLNWNLSEKEVLYTINNGFEELSYRLILPENSTVFSLLESLSRREGFVIETTFYPEMGILVENINDFENGTEDKYWQYWVNGELPMEAADKKEIKANDKIEWKFETISF